MHECRDIAASQQLAHLLCTCVQGHSSQSAASSSCVYVCAEIQQPVSIQLIMYVRECRDIAVSQQLAHLVCTCVQGHSSQSAASSSFMYVHAGT